MTVQIKFGQIIDLASVNVVFLFDDLYAVIRQIDDHCLGKLCGRRWKHGTVTDDLVNIPSLLIILRHMYIAFFIVHL